MGVVPIGAAKRLPLAVRPRYPGKAHKKFLPSDAPATSTAGDMNSAARCFDQHRVADAWPKASFHPFEVVYILPASPAAGKSLLAQCAAKTCHLERACGG